MRILKTASRDARPSVVPARVDREAMRERASYIEARYAAPPDEAEKIVASMDIPTQVLLAIEMRSQQRRGFTSDYDPLGTL